MINLYKPNETNFDHNEFVLNDCIKCEVTETLDGNTFDLNLEYPSNDRKGISKEIVTGSYIKVPVSDDRNPQLFCLRQPKTTLSRVEGYAHHVAIAKLSKNMIKDTNIVNKNRKQALQQILANTMNPHNFSVGTKDANTTVDNLRIVRYNPYYAMLGSEDNTILNRYGGEIIFDNFTLDMVDTRGIDTGLIVSYKKNLTGVELTTDDLELMTEIIPVGNDGLLLPEYSIKSPLVNNYVDIYTKEVKVDIGVVEATYDINGVIENADEVVTTEQAYAYMRQYVANMYTYEKADQLNFNLTVNFIHLQDTEEYKSYNNLAKIKQPGDVITVKHEALGLNLTGRVQKIKWDAIKQKIIEVEIGFKKTSIVNTLKKATKKISTIDEKIDNTKTELKEDIESAKTDTKTVKTTLEAADGVITASVENFKTETTTKFQVKDGEISAIISRVDGAEASIVENADEIALRVRTSQFGSLIQQHANSIVNAIEGVTNNTTTLDTSGFHVSGGAFDFSGYNNEKLIEAVADGSVTAIRIGDDDWSKETAMTKVYLGRYALGQFLSAWLIADFDSRTEDILRNYGLIT